MNNPPAISSKTVPFTGPCYFQYVYLPQLPPFYRLNEVEDSLTRALRQKDFQPDSSNRLGQLKFTNGNATIYVQSQEEDVAYSFTVQPPKWGPTLYQHVLERSLFLSEGQYWLTNNAFWGGSEGSICINANNSEVITLLNDLGYTLKTNNELNLSDQLRLIRLIKTDDDFLLVAIQTSKLAGNLIWIKAVPQLNIFPIAALIHQRIKIF